jgi:hypothetical protein
MKWTKIKYQDYDELQLSTALFMFLEALDIKSAIDAANICQASIDDEFCSECKIIKDDCECREDDYGRYMREYDDGADYED